MHPYVRNSVLEVCPDCKPATINRVAGKEIYLKPSDFSLNEYVPGV